MKRFLMLVAIAVAVTIPALVLRAAGWLRLDVWGALSLIGLFAVQVVLAFVFRNDEPLTVTTLTWLAWLYMGPAAILFALNARRTVDILRAAVTGRIGTATPGIASAASTT